MNKKLFQFLVPWIVVTMLGSAFGLAVAFSFEGDEDYHPLYLLLGFAISGFLSSFGQWAIMRAKTGNAIWRWIPGTTLGIPIGLFIGFWVYQLLWLLLQNYSYYWTASLIMAITAGLFTGIIQWRILFRSFPNPVWLLLSSVSLVGISIFYPYYDNPIYFFEPINEIFLGTIFGGLTGLFLGIVSGVNIAMVMGESRERR